MKYKKWYLKLSRFLVPFGMVSSTLYVLHIVLGTALWPEYSSVVDPISLLTADSAPHAALLRILTGGFAICQLLFSIGILILVFTRYGKIMRASAICYIIMSSVALVQLFIFPLADDGKAGLQNSLHTFVSALMIVLIMVSIYLVAIGFFTFENMHTMGIVTLTAAMCIAIFGIIHAVMEAQDIPMQGLTERLSAASYQCFVFFVSFAYTFNIKMVREKPQE